MEKINWKAKLSSRKFWAAVLAWLTSLLTAFGVTDSIIARVSIIVAGFGSLAVYMLAEALTDKARANPIAVGEALPILEVLDTDTPE
jgi:uncharacterized membrane protein